MVDDDPSENDRTVGVTAPPFSTAQPQFAPPGEYHHFPATLAGHSRVVISTTPMKRKKVTKDKCSSESGNEVRVTEKLLELFKESPDSSLDLNKAAEALKVPKRRLYDITNVLEGIGLAEKKHKNAIHWKSGIQEETNSELDASVVRLKASFEDFNSKEHELDEQISEMRERIKKFVENEYTRKSLFLTENELKGLPCFENQTLIVVRAPQGTTLEVPDPNQGGNGAQRRYRIIFRSDAGPIQVYLVSNAAENSLACLDAGEQGEIVPSDDANLEDNDYWIPMDPGFCTSDLWDLSRKIAEVQWDHFSSEEVPTVPQGRDEKSSSDLNAFLKP